MFTLGLLIGAIALAVLEAIASIVIYVVCLRRSTRPGRPAAYTLPTPNQQRAAAGLPAYAPGVDDLSDGRQPASPALADWADARLRAAGLVGLHVSRRFAPLRVDSHHVAFWAADELSWLRLGMTFVSVDDVALVNLHAPLKPTPIDIVDHSGRAVRRVQPSPARSSLTTDPTDPRLGHGVDDTPRPQQEAYLVLSPAERARGHVRPVRLSYIHARTIEDVTACGTQTTMSREIAETYARDPKFYGSTYCTGCRMHLPVAAFLWAGTTEPVGS